MSQNFFLDEVDVAVVGGGHAGVEAALAARRLGCRVALVTFRLDDIARLACNPAIGGVGKGQLVREIDALGGLMARAADAAAIQTKTLNAAKGPAVQSPRAQVDKNAYMRRVRQALDADDGLSLLQGRVVDFLPPDGGIDGDGDGVVQNKTGAGVGGLLLAEGVALRARAVVLCAGTFLRARLYLGRASWPGGRHGEGAADELSAALERLGVPLRRQRTDTPPRVRGRGLDFSAMRVEWGDEPARPFAFDAAGDFRVQPLACHGVWTNERVHAAVRAAVEAGGAPAFSGALAGAPPRYCPNIESKVTRFPEVERHHVFVEPESRDEDEYYLNGLSTSIPPDAQYALVRALPGFARAEIARFGYAVEYDVVAPGVLCDTLAAKDVPGLYFAGQLNGTSGYEEAAAQGLYAGANAALHAQGRPPWRLGRHEAYLGVMVDDLVGREQEEPYRVFTSRAEHRLALRQDNADLRLVPAAARLGLVAVSRAEAVEALRRDIDEAKQYLEATRLCPEAFRASVAASDVEAAAADDGEDNRDDDDDGGGARAALPAAPRTLAEWVRRPKTRWENVARVDGHVAAWSPRVAEQAFIEIRYAGYLARQEGERRKFARAAGERIPGDFDYEAVAGLSREARETLSRRRPETVSQAARLAGVRPSDAALLALRLVQSRAEAGSSGSGGRVGG